MLWYATGRQNPGPVCSRETVFGVEIFLDAVKYGWERVDGRLHPKTTDVGIAPESALKVLKCSCNKFQIDCTQYCACSEECCSNKTDEDEDEDEG